MKIYYMGYFYMLILTMHSKTGWEGGPAILKRNVKMSYIYIFLKN